MGALPTEVMVNGERVLLRACVPDDAGATLDYLRVEMGTTDQVLTQPDELSRSAEEERARSAELFARGGLRMIALHGGLIIGAGSLHPGQRRRNRHTAELGITVARA